MDMRTAKAIYESKMNSNRWVIELMPYEKDVIIEMINDARKEAMNDVAKKILETNIYNGGNTIVNDRVRDKIDSLIEQVK